MRLAVCENQLYVCGRGTQHFFVERYNPSTVSWTALSTQSFMTDAGDWAKRMYYSTIRLIAIQDKIYVFARGTINIHFSTYSLSTNSWTIEYFFWLGDSGGWGNAQYYETIRLTELDGQLFVIARGAHVLHIGEFNPTTTKWMFPPSPPAWMGDAQGFDQPEYYSTIRIQAFAHRIYIFTRTPLGAQIAYYIPAEQRLVLTPPVSLFIEGDGWELPKCYKTIRAEAHEGKWYICGKGIRSLLLVCFDTQSNDWRVLPTTNVLLTLTADAAFCYETFRMALVSDKLVIFARGNNSSIFLNFNLRTREWEEPPTRTDKLSAEKYNEPSYYSTVMTATVGDRLYVCMRGEQQLQMVSYDSPQRSNS